MLGADLFAGAGGLSRGLTDAGIEVVFGVDHFEAAVETHAAQFPGMSVNWDLAEANNIDKVSNLMLNCGIEVLAGGPPCQPFSLAGRNGIRRLVELGKRDPYDARRDLWRAYLEVVQLVKPKAVIMENVPNMALDSEMFILRSMIEELEQLGYSVEERVIEAWRYGVPQNRKRLVIVGIFGDIKFEWPKEENRKVTVWNAISDLPEIEGGWHIPENTERGMRYSGPITDFQKRARKNVAKVDQGVIFDHITRYVREDDREAFEDMTPETKYSELPEKLRRYRTDIFEDKYKRLDENDLSRTITAHMAKDGYGFIHPRQPRTLSVREAARIQTFPDDFRFAGTPTLALRQIGNAVPVRMGEAIALSVLKAIEIGAIKDDSAINISKTLADWFRKTPKEQAVYPWLRSESRWKMLACEILLNNSRREDNIAVWKLVDSLPEPKKGEVVPAETVDAIGFVLGSMAGYERRYQKFLKIVAELNEAPNALWESRIRRDQLPSIGQTTADFIELAMPVEGADGKLGQEPVLVFRGVLRVLSRYQGMDVESRNKTSDGRIAMARMLGLNPNSRAAHLAVIEIAQGICTPVAPKCEVCPLWKKCRKFGVEPQLALKIVEA